MARHLVRASRAARDALVTLGSHIKMVRIERGWTQAELAGRVGVDIRTIASIEKGAPTVAIGTVFNTAFMVGVDLFGLEGDDLALARRRGQERLALLPHRVRNPATKDSDDDF